MVAIGSPAPYAVRIATSRSARSSAASASISASRRECPAANSASAAWASGALRVRRAILASCG